MDLLTLKWSNHMPAIYKSLSFLRHKDVYSDVSLVCDGKFYDVNKLVLSSCSDYFKEIFKQTPSKSLVIVLKDISNVNLELLLDYMYIGELNVRQADLSELIKAAEYLKIKGLAGSEELDTKTRASKCTKRPISSPMAKIKKKKLSPVQEYNMTELPQEDIPNTEIHDTAHNNEESPNENTERNFFYKKEIFIKDEYDPEDATDSIEFSDNDSHHYPSVESQDSSISDSRSVGMDNVMFEDISTMDHSLSTVPVTDQRLTDKEKGPSEHDCSFCGKMFTQKGNCKRHERIHTGEKPFECPFCQYKAAQKQDVSSHIFFKHVNKVQTSVPISEYVQFNEFPKE